MFGYGRVILIGLALAIAGCGGGGGGGSAAPAQAPVPVPPPNPGTVPNVPTITSVTVGDSQLTISWDAVTDATSYNLYMDTASGVSKATNSSALTKTGVTSPYVHTGLTNGTTYYFVVTAVNAAGEGLHSLEASGTPVATAASVTWSKITPVASTWQIRDIAVKDDQTIVASFRDAANGDDGVISTSNGGQSWTQVGAQFWSAAQKHSVVRIPSTGFWYAVNVGTNASSLYESSTGIGWSSVGPYDGTYDFRGLVVGQNSVYALHSPNTTHPAYNTTYDEIYHLKPGGVGPISTTTLVSGNLPNGGFYGGAVDPRDDNVVYLATSVGLHKKTTANGSWAQLDPTVKADVVAIDPNTPDTLYAGRLRTSVYSGGNNEGLWKSSNAGTSWTKLTTGLPSMGTNASSREFLTALVVDKNGVVWAGFTNLQGSGQGGVWRSTDSGTSWNAVSTGIGSSPSVWSLAVDAATDVVYAGTEEGIFKTQ